MGSIIHKHPNASGISLNLNSPDVIGAKIVAPRDSKGVVPVVYRLLRGKAAIFLIVEHQGLFDRAYQNKSFGNLGACCIFVV